MEKRLAEKLDIGMVIPWVDHWVAQMVLPWVRKMAVKLDIDLVVHLVVG